MKRPPILQQGDTIGIAATARKVSEEELKPAVLLLESWGFKVKPAPSLFSAYHQFAGSDEGRAEGFQHLLDDPAVKAIICARGGYGTVRIIDRLNFMTFHLSPKWIIGYSDITVLHSHIHSHFPFQTLHAAMTLNMSPDNADTDSLESLKSALMSEEKIHVPASPFSLNRNGEAEGILIGGNLSVLYSLLGSDSDIDTQGKILFLEDLDEYLYHIDRMMMNMKRNGKLHHLAGLIIGGMNNMKDNTIPFGKTAEEIILESVKEFHFPVGFNFPAGHGKRNLALRFGAVAKLSVGNDGSMLIID